MLTRKRKRKNKYKFKLLIVPCLTHLVNKKNLNLPFSKQNAKEQFMSDNAYSTLSRSFILCWLLSLDHIAFQLDLIEQKYRTCFFNHLIRLIICCYFLPSLYRYFYYGIVDTMKIVTASFNRLGVSYILCHLFCSTLTIFIFLILETVQWQTFFFFFFFYQKKLSQRTYCSISASLLAFNLCCAASLLSKKETF